MNVAIWAAIIAGVASIIVVLIQKFVRDRSKKESERINAALNRVKGGIDKPTANQQVGRTIHCTGWARNLEANLHLWLAVRQAALFGSKKMKFTLMVMAGGKPRFMKMVLLRNSSSQSSWQMMMPINKSLIGFRPGSALTNILN